jgi:hypothetical protein
MKLNKGLAQWLLFAGYAICLLQIWWPAYFATGDGPCHVYNAQIIHDLMIDKNTSFYNHYYLLSDTPNPNWLTHILLALLMFIVNGVIAEKILLTAYVLLFVFGFTTLLKRLANGNAYLPLFAFLFVINAILIKGFYNFSFSIAIFFWLVEIWMQYIDTRKLWLLLSFFFLAIFLFFAHPLAFAFGCFCCGALTASSRVSESTEPSAVKLKAVFRDLFFLLLCIAPGMFLFLKFANSEGGAKSFHLYLERYRFADLLHNNYLVTYTSHEEPLLRALAVFMCVLFLLAMFFRLRKGFSIQKYDGIILTCALAGYVYLRFPDNLLGGSAFTIRAHYILFLLATCCIALLIPTEKIKNAIGLVIFGCFIALSAIRFPCQLSASAGVADINSAVSYIKPYAVVLPLNFSPNGKDEKGKLIADRTWLFPHASDYMGTSKPLMMLDNYEANAGYFPLNWLKEINPYHNLGKDEGIEGLPPSADIAKYRRTSWVTVNYVIMWCYDSSWLQNAHFKELHNEINANYHLVYTSASGRTTLFEKN